LVDRFEPRRLAAVLFGAQIVPPADGISVTEPRYF